MDKATTEIVRSASCLGMLVLVICGSPAGWPRQLVVWVPKAQEAVSQPTQLQRPLTGPRRT